MGGTVRPSYPRPPGGSYRVHVQTVDLFGQPAGPESSLIIRVLAPWWQRPWAGVSLLAGMMAGAIGITRYIAHRRIRTQLAYLKEERLIEKERLRIARDIHDTLAQGFTGVIMQLEAAKGATVQGDLAEATNRMERASELARSSLGEARRSVRALRPRSLRSGKLFVALDDLLKRTAEGTDLNAEFHADGDERSIPADVEEGLLRITQEALTNAVKHASARNFRATLSVAASEIQIRLVDDGRGFDPQQEHDGFGLTGMKERVDRMGGQFIIRSKSGVGTELLIELKNLPPLKPENLNGQS
jgi:signal transduction histidine kinase